MGWIDSEGKEYLPASVFSGNSDLVLTAVWKIKTYTVTYDANGGVGAPESLTKTYGVDITLSSAIPTKENCDFRGWAISASGSVVYSPGTVYTDDSDLKLYAVWKVAILNCSSTVHPTTSTACKMADGNAYVYGNSGIGLAWDTLCTSNDNCKSSAYCPSGYIIPTNSILSILTNNYNSGSLYTALGGTWGSTYRYFWSSTDYDTNYSYVLYVSKDNAFVYWGFGGLMDIRCYAQ